MSQCSFFLFLVFLVIVFAPLADIAKAQNSEKTSGALEGTVKAVNGNMIEINGSGPPIDISEIEHVTEQDTSQDLPPSSIIVGVNIFATVFFREGQSSAVAKQIFIDLPDVAIIIGRIESIDPASRTIVVLSRRVLFTDKTIFPITKNGPLPSFERLKVGKFIRIAARSVGNDVVALLAYTDKRFIGLPAESASAGSTGDGE